MAHVNDDQQLELHETRSNVEVYDNGAYVQSAPEIENDRFVGMDHSHYNRASSLRSSSSTEIVDPPDYDTDDTDDMMTTPF